MNSATTISEAEKLACSVDAFIISVRGANVLKNQGIRTIQDLVNTDARELLAAPNCGKKTLAEIMACLKMVELKMANCDGLCPESAIDERMAYIRNHLAKSREPEPRKETYQDRRAKEIEIVQQMVMLMRVNGSAFNAIGKAIGRTGNTARIHFRRFSRSLVWEAQKRKLPLADILTEKNIPLAAIELMKKDGIRVEA